MNKKSIATTVGALILGVAAGAGIMLNDTAYSSVKQAIGQGATNNAIGGINGQNIASMDIETALMAVQSERTRLLDAQLQEQIKAVQERNTQMAQLNSLLNELRVQRTGQAPYSLPAGLHDQVKMHLIQYASKTSFNAAEMDSMIQELKQKIDAANNSQQMDMLRLQSMSNKRNEAFDVMTNFVKKMQDSRSSIIGNMR
ncbi:hypothetical protein WMW72_28495 [Paenibacillus filicis]|uniref:Secreted protein n=1 Tax=Paenibacillus filicis TaxID=669464 RepID=A0ABU9DSL1_9BACL